jgi:hypothetical protein
MLLTAFLIITVPSLVSSVTTCGVPQSLTPTYLQGLKLGEFSNFIPSVYYLGSATKFVTTNPIYAVETIFSEELCVDGDQQPSEIKLYDDGTNGDDIAGDGVYSRACIHFCESVVDFADYWNFAFERHAAAGEARLVAMDPSLQGQIPSQQLPNTHYPDAQLWATSHALFFVDDSRVYMPEWPVSRGTNGDGPSGKSIAAASVLQVFGDVFDFFTITGFEANTGIEGAGIYKWQSWVKMEGEEGDELIGGEVTCTSDDSVVFGDSVLLQYASTYRHTQLERDHLSSSCLSC